MTCARSSATARRSSARSSTRCDGAREWGVKALLDREQLEAALAADEPALAELRSEAAAGTGSAFFARKRLEQELEERLRDAAAEIAEAVHDRLSLAARDAVDESSAAARAVGLRRRDDPQRRLPRRTSGASASCARPSTNSATRSRNAVFASTSRAPGPRSTSSATRRGRFDEQRAAQAGAALLSRPQIDLAELLDRTLGAGVVVAGDVTLSVADVELVYLNLRALLASVATLEAQGIPFPANGGSGVEHGPGRVAARARRRRAPTRNDSRSRSTTDPGAAADAVRARASARPASVTTSGSSVGSRSSSSRSSSCSGS